MGRVVSAISFFPRGGSAHAARGLARELPRHGWTVRLVSGSRSGLGGDADAGGFYRDLDVRRVDYTEGDDADGPPRDPEAVRAPMHPSYEDRPGASDRAFATLDDADFERQVRPWEEALSLAEAPRFDVLHLHHL